MEDLLNWVNKFFFSLEDKTGKTTSATKNMAILFACLTLVYYIVFFINFDKKDETFFGWDTWEYQSMGVNFAMGHGIQKFGAMEPFATYKFESFTETPAYYNEFFANAGNNDFLRTPAYPLFLGVIYKLFGIHPAIVTAIQLFLMVIIAASLPFIGYYYWGKSGLIGGVPAGIFYLIANYQLAEYILTEALTAFSVFLFVVAFIVFERWRETMTAVILGISLGIALLLKGSLVFLPIFTCVFIFIRAIKGHDIAQWKLLLITAASIVVVILPWSIYASSNSGQFVILSMQGDTEILDGNNELCIIDGRWHPEWINDPNAFYNNDGIDNTRVIEKVLNFYWHKPSYLPQCLFQKLYRSFMPFPLLLIFLGLMLLDGLFSFLNSKMNSRLLRSLAGVSLFQVPTWTWIVTGNFLMIASIFYWDGTFVSSRLVAPMAFVFALLGCVSIVRFFSNIYVFLRLR